MFNLLIVLFFAKIVHATPIVSCDGLGEILRPDSNAGFFIVKKEKGVPNCLSFTTLEDTDKRPASFPNFDLSSSASSRIVSTVLIENQPHYLFNIKEISSTPSIRKELEAYGGIYFLYGSYCESGMYYEQKFILSQNDQQACSFLKQEKLKIENLKPKLKCDLEVTATKGFLTIYEEYSWEFVQMDIISNGKRVQSLTREDLEKHNVSLHIDGNMYLNVEQSYKEFTALNSDRAYAIVWQDHMDQNGQYCVFGRNQAYLKQEVRTNLKSFYPKEKMRWEFVLD
jgi:hypothetical protein